MARTVRPSFPRQTRLNLDSALSVPRHALSHQRARTSSLTSIYLIALGSQNPTNDCAHVFLIEFSYSVNLACLVWAGYSILGFILTSFGAQMSGGTNYRAQVLCMKECACDLLHPCTSTKRSTSPHSSSHSSSRTSLVPCLHVAMLPLQRTCTATNMTTSN